ncbi:Crp/Fnr family transcriptional regulator [Olivibacter sp. CPCC 100613]|uniref:Crp/Fnr family transcriptional regulator n=1 Tax=Olivibacter sp. CPCC 100613 TaxID=3079931 RepID=UPI002FF7FEE7
MANNRTLLKEKMRRLGLREPSLSLFYNALEEVHYKKGTKIIKAGRTEPHLYFILDGIARVFIQTAEKETVFCFCLETDVILSYNSFFNESPGYETIELLEDSQLVRVSHRKVKALCKSDLTIANFFNRLIGLELVKTEERLIGTQSRTATARYTELITLFPSIVQRVQLGYIASYLGVSQVTLSRIRKKISR